MELLDKGEHCATCGQIDFLPFTCAGCKQHFCVEHRTAEAHSCPKAGSGDQGEVFVCPLCARGVKLWPGEAPDVAFERHAYSDCDPSNFARVHQKKRCPVQGCREKLTAVSSFTCKDCAAIVCLKHRLGSDHGCAAQRQQRADAAGAAEGRLRAIRSFFSRADGGGQAPSGAAGNGSRSSAGSAPPQSGKQRLAAAASRVGGSLTAQLGEYRARLAAHRAAESGRAASGAPPAPPRRPASPPEVVDLTCGSPARPPARRGAAGAAGAGAGAAGSSGTAVEELCPVCGARFASVEALIDHGMDAHTGGWASGAVGMQQHQQQGLELCPHCGAGVGDAAALVEHVQRCVAAPRAGAISGAERCTLS